MSPLDVSSPVGFCRDGNGLCVGVAVGVCVGVRVGVLVAVAVCVGVGVAVGMVTVEDSDHAPSSMLFLAFTSTSYDLPAVSPEMVCLVLLERSHELYSHVLESVRLCRTR